MIDSCCSRRSVLQLGGTSFLSVFAGCSGFSSSNSVQGTYLRLIELQNDGENTHTVSLQVQRNDEIVHDDSYTLQSGEPTGELAFVEATWPNDPAEFKITIQWNNSKIESKFPDTRSSSDEVLSCMGLKYVIYNENAAVYTGNCPD